MATEKRLTRSANDRMLGGVCGGIGEYFDIDPTLVRIGFAALVLVGVGSPILLYLLLWMIMPAPPQLPAGEDGLHEAPAHEPARSETELQAVAAATSTDVVDDLAHERETAQDRVPTAEM